MSVAVEDFPGISLGSLLASSLAPSLFLLWLLLWLNVKLLLRREYLPEFRSVERSLTDRHPVIACPLRFAPDENYFGKFI